MNILSFIANIKIVLTIIIATLIIIIFPIFLNVKIVFDDSNVLRYKINLFSIFKIFGGNVELLEDGIIIHLTKSKAILIKYSELIDLRKKFEPIKDFHLVQFITDIEMGAEDILDASGIISFSYLLISSIIKCIVNTFKPYVEMKTNIKISESKDIFGIKVRITLIFNLLIVIISAIKILMEKIIYAIKNTRQQSE